MSHDTEHEDLSDLIGTPDYTGGGKRAEEVTLKQGTDVIARVFPPIKSMKAKGEWALYWGLTWGWKGRNPKDPTKLRSRPVLAIEEKNWKTGMIIQDDPLIELIRANKEKLEHMAVDLKRSGKKAKDDPDFMQLYAWLNGKETKHSTDYKWRIPALTLDGRYIILKLNHTCKSKKLQPEIDKLLQKKHTPLGPKGVFFQFSRVGDGREVEDSVVPYRIEDEEGNLGPLHFHTLTREIVETGIKMFPDLYEEKERNRYTYSQMKQLAECSEDPDEVDEILGVPDKEEGAGKGRVISDGGGGTKNGSSDDLDEPEETPPPPKTTKKPETKAPPKETQKKAPPKEEPADEPAAEEEDEDDAELKALLAKKAAKDAAKKAAAKAAEAPAKVEKKPETKKAPPKEEAEEKDENSDDDWESMFNNDE